MSEFRTIGPFVRIWRADEQDAQQGLESIKHELSDLVFQRISGALKRLAGNDGAPATWCPHCAEAEANPLPPPGSEGEE